MNDRTNGIPGALFSVISRTLLILMCVFAAFAVTFLENPPKAISNSILESFSGGVNLSEDTIIKRIFGVKDINAEDFDSEEEPTVIDYGMSIDEVLLNNQDDINDKKVQDVKLPEGAYPIKERNLSGQKDSSLKLLYKNKTGKSINDKYINKLLEKAYPIKIKSLSEGPSVLIVHTHTTECYAEEGKGYYIPKNAVAETRSRDDGKNVIAVGDVFEEVLTGMGIGVIHCKDYHDIYVFNESYSHSYSTVKKYLEAYPTIKYVIDLHRDSVIQTNGTKVCPVTTVNGKKCAQMMILVGTDDNGLKHDNWETNMTLAVKLQDSLVKKYGEIVRPMVIRSGRFNQQLCKGMLLFEIGACGNTLEQAKNTARFVAVAYGELIIQNSGK